MVAAFATYEQCFFSKHGRSLWNCLRWQAASGLPYCKRRLLRSGENFLIGLASEAGEGNSLYEASLGEEEGNEDRQRHNKTGRH